MHRQLYFIYNINIEVRNLLIQERYTESEAKLYISLEVSHVLGLVANHIRSWHNLSPISLITTVIDKFLVI